MISLFLISMEQVSIRNRMCLFSNPSISFLTLYAFSYKNRMEVMSIFSNGGSGCTDFQICRIVFIGSSISRRICGNPSVTFVSSVFAVPICSRIKSSPSGEQAVTYPLSYSPYLPARPAICFTSAGFNGLVSFPSNLSVCINTIRRTGRFNPIPMASVDTITPVSFSVNRCTCLLRICGGRLP